MVMKERSRAITMVITKIAMLSCSRKENLLILSDALPAVRKARVVRKRNVFR